MKWFAIFKTGTHTDSSGNKKEWTEQDLDKIVSTYDPTKHESPIVIGHPKANAPAFGWVDKLKRVGDTLYAMPKQLANEFVEMVKKGLFKKRSISLYPDGSLRHIGFLGAQPPAVKGLPDVEFKDDDQSATIEGEQFTDLDEADDKKSDNEKVKELQKQIDSYQKQLSDMTTKEREFEQLQTKYAEIIVEKNRLEAELIKQKRESEEKDFEEYLDKAISDGKLLPKMKEHFSKIYKVLSLTPEYEFSEGVKTQSVDVIKEFIESMPRLIDFTNSKSPSNKNQDKEPVSKIVAEEIKKQMNQ